MAGADRCWPPAPDGVFSRWTLHNADHKVGGRRGNLPLRSCFMLPLIGRTEFHRKCTPSESLPHHPPFDTHPTSGYASRKSTSRQDFLAGCAQAQHLIPLPFRGLSCIRRCTTPATLCHPALHSATVPLTGHRDFTAFSPFFAPVRNLLLVFSHFQPYSHD